MATVYLAEDLKHRRKVAIKVLRAELAAVIGADRFLAEITTTANLQHPNILPLHDSGEAASFLFYVMPFVEGESLRDRLNREKQLPVVDAVRIATEVAGALDYAHRRGVIHRDIKPENILLHDGRALVADFGIALAASKGGSTRMTETGMSLGTPHYMSPEQAMGEREIGPESDVYALGAVTYEMLVGEPPFSGPTAQSIVAKVMTDEPRPLIPQRHTIPPHVEAAVLTALEKLPADRFLTAKAFADALGSERYTRPMPTMRPAAPGGWGWWKPVAIAAMVVAALATAFALTGHPADHAGRAVTRYLVAFPDSQAPEAGMIFTPDGSRLAYVGPNGRGGTQLWLKERGRAEPAPIPATSDPKGFTVSPDGQWLALVQDGKLRKMPIAGGTPIVLADSVFFTGLAWVEDGTLYYTTSAGALARVSEHGGAATILWRPDRPQLTPALLAPLPGGRGVFFTLCNSNCTSSDLYVFDARARKARLLVPDVLTGMYLSMGYLAFVRRDGVMRVVPFDLGALEVRGTPKQVLSGITLLSGIVPSLTVSATGTLLMESGGVGGELGIMDFTWVSRNGERTALDTSVTFSRTVAHGNQGWSLSPDGKHLAVGMNTRSGDDIWIKDLPSGPLSRLTFDTASEVRPHWSPDGRSVTFVTPAGLGERRADGTGEQQVIVPNPRVLEGAWSRDGTWLVLRIGGLGGLAARTGDRDIVGMRPGVDSALRPLVASAGYDEDAPALSPDGKWLAYESDENGAMEIFIRPFPTTDGGRWQVSANGGQAPLWSHSGRELFYVDADRNMISVPVAGGVSPGLGERRKLFQLPNDLYLGQPEHYTPFDISPDDQRFIMMRTRLPAVRGRSTFVLVENWFEEVRGMGGKQGGTGERR